VSDAASATRPLLVSLGHTNADVFLRVTLAKQSATTNKARAIVGKKTHHLLAWAPQVAVEARPTRPRWLC
jgi:hypothetical protein